MFRRTVLLGALGLIASSVPALSQPDSKNIPFTSHDADILARTLYGEARGEINDAQIAVAHSVFNRVASSSPLFDKDTTVSVACLRRGQYSCWKKARHLLLHIPASDYTDSLNTVYYALDLWEKNYDFSNDATNYLRVGEHTMWSRKFRKVKRIGSFEFYKAPIEHS